LGFIVQSIYQELVAEDFILFHFHFISVDKKKVYHIYTFEANQTDLTIEKMTNIDLMLPDTIEYRNAKINNVSNKNMSSMNAAPISK
jgi:alpha-acetolactate decarboxylase